MNREEIPPPAKSAEYIASHSQNVKIHANGLDKLCDEILSSLKSDKLAIPETGANIQYPGKDDNRTVDWIFVADSLNFCFWSYSDADRWMVDGHTGYYALEAALSRALKEGHNISDPNYYSKITKEQLMTIMRGDNSTPIPLFEERLSVLHQVGEVLLEKFNGSFKTCIKEADKSAVKLLQLVVDNFPCFRDEAIYKGTKVSLYKRAQILVADIWNFYGGKDWGEFTDIDKITMFADYRIPQVLVYFGVLSYSEELMEKLEKDELLPSGSEKEVEVRGCSIHCVELLRKKLAEKLKDRPNVTVPNSSLIDYYLWCYRRKYAADLEKVPFHKTLGIFY